MLTEKRQGFQFGKISHILVAYSGRIFWSIVISYPTAASSYRQITLRVNPALVLAVSVSCSFFPRLFPVCASPSTIARFKSLHFGSRNCGKRA
jgi:hypothetical protein